MMICLQVTIIKAAYIRSQLPNCGKEQPVYEGVGSPTAGKFLADLISTETRFGGILGNLLLREFLKK